MEGCVNSPINGKTEENCKMASVITCGAHVEIQIQKCPIPHHDISWMGITHIKLISTSIRSG
jgi:ribonuclease BN (tRNA processing enzyme)